MSDFGLSRDEAYALLNDKVKTKNLIKHCIATEAIMRALARKFGEDEEFWGLTGLLHDLDYDNTLDTPEQHTLVTEKILKDKGVSSEAIEAIKEHNAEAIGIERKTRLGIALTAAETITGLIVATALVLPDKKIASIKPKSIRKRMKEKAFARGVNREYIMLIEQLGIALDDFIVLSLEAMSTVADQLGL